MKIELDVNTCAGHGLCASLAPDVFDLDELGYAEQPAGETPAEFRPQATKAAIACPEGAITLVE
jgi:ferredoxin